MYNRTDMHSGMTVYSSDGHKIGTIGDVGMTHFKTDTGFLGLGKDFYIPFTAVSRTQGNDVYLNVMKDRLNEMSWDRQPVGWAS